MTEVFNRKGIYKIDHTTFGGIIYQSDFDICYTNGNIASRIAMDWRFDQQCKKNIEGRSRKYKESEESQDAKGN